MSEPIQLRAELSFESFASVQFDGFLPLESGAAPVPLLETGFTLRLYMDPGKHRGWVTDLDLGEIERIHGISSCGIFIQLDAEVPPSLLRALEDSATNDETRQFGERVLGALDRVHDALIEFARHDHQQFWLRPRRLEEGTCLQQRLLQYDVRLCRPDGWHLLRVGRNRMHTTVELREGINSATWRNLLEGLGRGKFRSPAHRRLLANAFAHLDRDDLRAAIVEVVAAWEIVLNREVPERLTALHVSYAEADWAGLIESAGLRAGTRLFLAFAPAVGAPADREGLLACIEQRNTVVHRGQYRFDPARVRSLVCAVRNMILACERSSEPSSGPPA